VHLRMILYQHCADGDHGSAERHMSLSRARMDDISRMHDICRCAARACTTYSAGSACASTTCVCGASERIMRSARTRAVGSVITWAEFTISSMVLDYSGVA
jgi:hypothetical protein